MTTTIEALIRDLVEWVAKEPRRYAEALDAWRTSCPRLPVWEDAVDRGYIDLRLVDGNGVFVFVTQAGQRFLDGGAHPASRLPLPPHQAGSPEAA
jgi:hypothetical protein